MSFPTPLPVPTPEYMAGSNWIGDHIDELTAEYPNHWVAVYKGRVVGADPELGKAQDAAERTCPRADIAYQFVDDGTLIF